MTNEQLFETVMSLNKSIKEGQKYVFKTPHDTLHEVWCFSTDGAGIFAHSLNWEQTIELLQVSDELVPVLLSDLWRIEKVVKLVQ